MKPTKLEDNLITQNAVIEAPGCLIVPKAAITAFCIDNYVSPIISSRVNP